VTRFTDHLYTQLVTTSNYSVVANLHTFQTIRAHAKSSQSVLTSRFLVTDPNSVLCLLPYRLTIIPQLTNSQAGSYFTLTYYSSLHWFQLKTSLPCTALHCTARHSLTNCPGYKISARTAQEAPSSVTVQLLLIKNLFPSSGRCLWRHYSATVLHDTVWLKLHFLTEADPELAMCVVMELAGIIAVSTVLWYVFSAYDAVEI
jgi:hypothetical protein